MARTGRPGISAEQRKELWRRWKDGESLSDIGRALGKHAASVFSIVIAKGGIAPSVRRRRSLEPRLEAQGYRVFADILSFEPGDRWRKKSGDYHELPRYHLPAARDVGGCVALQRGLVTG